MKRSLTIILCVLLLLPTLCFEAVAAETEAFAFIDGENITRTADTAIIYRGVASTKQTQWGHNIVVDAEGVVTDIIESGVSEGEDLAVPENGYVVSAAGNRVAWFKSNIKKGSKLCYDAYTQRLFLLDAAGSFDPYFTKQFTLTEKAEGYVISNPLVSATPIYTYDIAVDASGLVVSRGSDVTPPEGGFTVSAATKSDTASLIMYAPVGAKCVIENGVMTLTYDKTMVRRTAELAVERANALALNAKETFVYTDHEAINTLVSECSVLINSGINYRTATSIAHRLDSELASLLVQSEIYELRAAFHTPEETDIIAVRETVKAAKAAGLNTLYLRLSNGYDSFIHLPEDNKFSQAKKFGGFDVLKAYISVCAEENIALGLCVDVYYNEYASIASPDWIMQTNGDEKGVSDKYFSPTNEEFKAYFLDYIGYVVKTYGVTEIMLDHLRYPKFSEDCDYGYDYITMQEFARSHEIPINEVEAIKTELFESPHWTKWVEYRKSSVTDMAFALSETIRELRPDARITAVSARDTVEHFYMQDCLGWLEQGYIDGITLALYDDIDGRDANDELAYYDSTVADKGEIIGAYTGRESFFFTALESSAAIPSRLIADAINDSRSIQADGFIFSSLDGYLNQNHYLTLKNGVMRSDAVSPIADTESVIRKTLEFAKEKINNFILANGGCDDATAADALNKINAALLTLDDGIDNNAMQTLESELAMLFAASNAKASVLTELEAVTKASLLHREFVPVTLPDDPEADESSEPEESSEATDESDASADESAIADESTPDTQKEKLRLDVGSLLIYLFVGITLVASIAAMLVAIKRKSKRPSGMHMPKASKREDNDE